MSRLKCQLRRSKASLRATWVKARQHRWEGQYRELMVWTNARKFFTWCGEFHRCPPNSWPDAGPSDGCDTVSASCGPKGILVDLWEASNPIVVVAGRSPQKLTTFLRKGGLPFCGFSGILGQSPVYRGFWKDLLIALIIEGIRSHAKLVNIWLHVQHPRR
jgi:hypothetical protein